MGLSLLQSRGTSCSGVAMAQPNICHNRRWGWRLAARPRRVRAGTSPRHPHPDTHARTDSHPCANAHTDTHARTDSHPCADAHTDTHARTDSHPCADARTHARKLAFQDRPISLREGFPVLFLESSPGRDRAVLNSRPGPAHSQPPRSRSAPEMEFTFLAVTAFPDLKVKPGRCSTIT